MSKHMYEIGSKEHEQALRRRWRIGTAIGLVAVTITLFFATREYKNYLDTAPEPPPIAIMYDAGDYYGAISAYRAEIPDHNSDIKTEIDIAEVPRADFSKLKPGQVIGSMSGLLFQTPDNPSGTRDMIMNYPNGNKDGAKNKALLDKSLGLLHWDSLPGSTPIGAPGFESYSAHNNAHYNPDGESEAALYMKNASELNPEILTEAFNTPLIQTVNGITYISRLREVVPTTSTGLAVEGLDTGRARFDENNKPVKTSENIGGYDGGIFTINNPDTAFTRIVTCYLGKPLPGSDQKYAYDGTNINMVGKDGKGKGITYEKQFALKINYIYQLTSYIDASGVEHKISGADDYNYSGLTQCIDTNYPPRD